MKKTKPIACPICFTTPKVVVKEDENGKSIICYNCGFMTYSEWKIGNDMTAIESTTGRLVRELRYEDEKTNQYWYPCVIINSKFGMVLPTGDKKDWHWLVIPSEPIPILEKVNHLIPGTTDEYYEMKFVPEHAVHFAKDAFNDACKLIKMEFKY